jgi:hypothetical protein
MTRLSTVFWHAISCRLHYATSRKASGSIPDEFMGFFLIDLILPASLYHLRKNLNIEGEKKPLCLLSGVAL